jgi:lipoprotein-anchoring transpeptidase ErfK/SrfK
MARLLAILALAIAAALPEGVAEAQALPGSPLALAHGFAREGEVRYRDPPVSYGGRYVVISLDEHRLYLMEDERVIWSAVVGTGIGTRLEGAGQRWEFSTPRGMFRVQYMEKDPVWRVPDWAFVQRGVPPPPLNDPSREEPNTLGTSAIYLEEDIAIHGTNEPDLLGQPVSHGCIRMTNEDVRRLFHEVQVGTPVIIY